MGRRRPPRPKKDIPGFRWEGDRLVPLSTTTWNEETQDWDINPDQSGLADEEIPVQQPPPEDPQGGTLLTDQDYDPGSEVNTFSQNVDGQTVVTTDTYADSADESTKTSTTKTTLDEQGNTTVPREQSQAEKDYYAALEAGENPVITQDHLDEIGMGEGGEGLTVDDVGPAQDPNPDEIPEEMEGFTSEHNAYIDPMTGEKQFQTREQWSASIGEDEKYGKGKGFTAPEGGKVKSGTLRRNIRKMAPSLISGGRTA